MIDWKSFILQLGLKGLTHSSNYVYFRCPICGDSQSNINKKSAYILGLDTDKPHFYCHRRNCTTPYGNNLISLFKHLDHNIYQRVCEELRNEGLNSFSDKKDEKKNIVIEKKTITDKKLEEFYKWIRPISSTTSNSEANKYLDRRQIGNIHRDKLFYFYGNPYILFQKIFGTDKYLDKDYRKKASHEGIIVPFVNRDKKAVGFGMRLFTPVNNFRFINLFVEDNTEFFFGEDKVDWNREVFILEGMFDKLSFDIDNQIIAMLSTNQKLDYLNKMCRTHSNVTYIYDYEYMNKNIEKSVGHALRNGNKVFLWPDTIDLHSIKDINDLKIKMNMKDNDLISFIKKNTYTELEASLVLSKRQIMTGQRLLF